MTDQFSSNLDDEETYRYGHRMEHISSACRDCLEVNLKLPLCPGSRVEVTGLRNAARLNGEQGTVLRMVDDTDRWAVAIAGEENTISIRERNLNCVIDPDKARLLTDICACTGNSCHAECLIRACQSRWDRVDEDAWSMCNVCKQAFRGEAQRMLHALAIEETRSIARDKIHLSLARDIGNVTMDDCAAVLQDSGKMQQAESYGKQLLEQRRAALGDRHPLVLTMIGNKAFHCHIAEEQYVHDCAVTLLCYRLVFRLRPTAHI